jgi:hypothetical protein
MTKKAANNAELIFREKRAYAKGVVEIVVWRVPVPVSPSVHGFKYRLAFVRNGKRVVGYDNERGKGDHKHHGEVESSYRFVDEVQLLEDFWRDINETQHEGRENESE